ncbi:MAG TPA: hypothetical protein HA294_03875 [Nanoarchaeota archaeon]|nr:hypothetical protein [Candidatus Woesearchaeota archaeon]HIH15548.1 hypothetical protein [Nanoarchaeota archaeon]HIH59120.1 hypothetical protein [Nanoarchaeota archaeon]HIJ05465.1 hypothetical protein [Nanoarchaeota archaeon]
MEHRERDALSEYLLFYLVQKGFSSHYPYKQFSQDKEARRKILFCRDSLRYLIFTHGDTEYRPNIGNFLASMEQASREGIASLSIFHQNVFYQRDENRRLRVGGTDVNRRKLFGLELALVPYGGITYFTLDKDLAVVHYGDTIADYELSRREYPRERIGKADLKIIKEVQTRTVFSEFDLCQREDLVKGMLLAEIYRPSPKDYIFVSPVMTEEVKRPLARELQFVLDEYQAGNTEPYFLLSDTEQKQIDEALHF